MKKKINGKLRDPKGADTSARPEDIANWVKANKDSVQPYTVPLAVVEKQER